MMNAHGPIKARPISIRQRVVSHSEEDYMLRQNRVALSVMAASIVDDDSYAEDLASDIRISNPEWAHLSGSMLQRMIQFRR